MGNSEFDFDAELRKLQDTENGALVLAANAANFYKGLRKEGLNVEVAIGITGLFIAYLIKVPMDLPAEDTDAED